LGCLLACGLAAPLPLSAEGWCDIVFKDVAQQAEIVVLARVDRARRALPELFVVETLKGECPLGHLGLTSRILEDYNMKDGDHVFVAMDAKRRPVGTARSLGVCTAVHVLPIRGGKLRSRDRLNYDSRSGSLTLDQIRHQLQRDLDQPSAHALLTGR
jgi:hypothetical protein